MRKMISVILLLLLLIGIPAAALAGAETVGSPQAPVDVSVPQAASDEHSITLVWHKPEPYADIVSYNIYMDGKLAGNTLDNKNFSAAKSYIDAFYADPGNKQAQPISIHNYTVIGLSPDTVHHFAVTAICRNGEESPMSNIVVQSTAGVPAAVSIAEYGAIGDGQTLNTGAIQKAIDACPLGGKVVVPAGVFKTGPVWLKSDMTLELAAGSRLLASENAADYAYWDKNGELRFYALINAGKGGNDRLKNIRMVGEGIIDGNGWQQDGTEADVTALPIYTHAQNTSKEGSLAVNHTFHIGILAKNSVQYAMENGLGFKSAYPRRPNTVTLKGVDGVYYQGFTLINPANHALGFSGSTRVTLNGVKVETYDANNGDGLNFGSSDGLTVFNCLFNTGDDDINFSAGQGVKDQRNPSTKNIWIFNNYIRRGHGAVVAGSHTAAWIENILAEDNVIHHTDVGLRCKTNRTSGGGARNILFRDNALKDIQKQAFIFTSEYSDPNAATMVEAATNPGVFRDIIVRNCTVFGTGAPVITVEGLEGAEHENLVFEHLSFYQVLKPEIHYLRNGSFTEILFDGQKDAGWNINHTSGLIFK